MPADIPLVAIVQVDNLVRLDGRWLPFDRVQLVDGYASSSDLAVRLPRTAALGALLDQPPPDDLPPGAVALWMDTTGEAAELSWRAPAPA